MKIPVLLSRETSSRFLFRALLLCLVLLIPFLVFVFLMSLPHNLERVPIGGEGQSYAVPRNWYESAESRGFKTITRLAIFSAAAAFGALGASISLISRTRDSRRVPENITIGEMVSIQLVGAIFAFLLALMFMGSLIRGSLFPNPGEWFTVIYLHEEFAKLLVWSFIAGFSERLVPQILENLVTRFKQEQRETEETEKQKQEKQVPPQ
jgi:hypothetical protein